MQRIDTATAVANKWGTGKNGFRDGDPTAAILATQLDAGFFDNVQEELAGAVEGAGIALDATNKAQLQAALAVFQQNSSFSYAADTGAANAYVVAHGHAVAAYAEGQAFSFKAAHANTGASTLNVDGRGTKAIQRPSGAALQAGDIVAGEMVVVRYDGAAFQLANPQTVPTVGAGDNSTKPASTAYVDAGLAAAISTAESTAESVAESVAEGWVSTNIQSLVAGCIAAVATAAGFVLSASATGYLKLPSWLGGWIVQWGQGASTGTVASNAGVTWPLSFPTACYQIVTTIQGSLASTACAQVTSANQTAASFTVTSNGAYTTGISFSFIAIGK